jgi:Zn-dependent oligopeptidase
MRTNEFLEYYKYQPVILAECGTKIKKTLIGKSGIHIKKENRGKFTASAKRAGMGVQEFARHVLANKEDYSSTQVKRANFARNFGGKK